MTKVPINPGILFAEKIGIFYPEPCDPFENAIWAAEFAEVFRQLAERFEEQHAAVIDRICIEGLTSVHYTIETPYTLTRMVDIGKLRRNLPEVFEKIVFIRSCDAEKILGRKHLYELAKAASPDRVIAFEQVNLGDLRQVLAESEIPAYISVVKKPQLPMIVPLGETP
ncbi:hypothetical protein [Methanorbis furvi]|uniref:Uncharacterized protein n=1 Tax=Methanorbis furvi TaxID=3028299 RepID=A0AAE4MCN9_9EURY|nr:hypothetical protein [Methanocorpusculaceae archaeon Ag1]